MKWNEKWAKMSGLVEADFQCDLYSNNDNISGSRNIYV